MSNYITIDGGTTNTRLRLVKDYTVVADLAIKTGAVVYGVVLLLGCIFSAPVVPWASAKLKAFVKNEDGDRLNKFRNIVMTLSRLELLEELNSDPLKDMAQAVFRNGQVYLSLSGVLDIAAEKARLNKELDVIEGRLKGYAAKLTNPNFTDKAPASVVEQEKSRQAEALASKEKLLAAIKLINDLG